MVKFYEPPVALLEPDTAHLSESISKFVDGTLNPIQFRAIRVAYGIYEQRKENTYMMRIRNPAGGITPAQIRKLGELSEKYGAHEYHVTTRQETQLHYVDISNAISVINELLTVGLSPRGGGGNTIRNIVTSYNAGISPEESFDTTPYVVSLTDRMIREADSWNLPRKFKISFSSDPRDNAHSCFHCLGFIAQIKNGQKGFKVYVAGGMGAKPILGHVLFDWVSDDRVYYVTRAVKTMFDKHGNRKNKHENRIRFLYEKLGGETFQRLVEEEYAEVQKTPGLELVLGQFDNVGITPDFSPVEVNTPEFDLWKSRFVFPQKQDGLSYIKVPLHLGDILNQDAEKLAALLEPFGENTIRLSIDQNMYVRNIPNQYLGYVYTGLQEIRTQSDSPRMISNMIACTGAATCKLGLCLPRGATPEIQSRLLSSHLQLDSIPELRIHMSGCPNTCGMHHAADIGFFGKVSRKDGRMLPAYWIVAGAIREEGKTRFARKIGEVASHDVPNFVHDLLERYIPLKANYKTFADYVDDRGENDIKEVAQKYADIPSFDTNAEYFKDWGAADYFTLVGLGKAECSAGMFDMIEVDVKTIEEAKTSIENSTSQDEINQALFNIVYCASRMLLIARGIDAHDNNSVFDQFVKHFIEAGLISDKFKDLVFAARLNHLSFLNEHRELVYLLGDEMIKLYKSMDDTLKFPADKVSKDPASPASTERVIKDFRGVACPMNFVKTRLALDTIQTGQILEVWLDNGEPIENVPGSVEKLNEGHKIMEKISEDGFWKVVIKKG
ncbi:sulfite reductase subunit beta (hemoprotein) [bacterium]|nr:sulfite reductase subunit beta (hemoprotein) [bacterium]